MPHEHDLPPELSREYVQDVNLDNFMDRLTDNMIAILQDPGAFPEQAAYTAGNPYTLGPRIPDANTMATRMVSGARNNADRWLQGSLNPRKNPKTEAVRAAPKYNNSMQMVIQQNRYAAGLNKWDEDAATATINAVGPQGYSQGVAVREQKIARAMQRLQPLLAAHVRTLDSMATTTDQEREAKMLANLRGMRAIGNALRGTTGPAAR